MIMQSDLALITSAHLESGCPTPTIAVSESSAEPVFQSFASIKLDIDSSELADRTANYLAYYVARSPRCLLAHVQRVDLHIRRNESKGVLGALLDLFVVLGTRGAPLRKRMLSLAKPTLNQDEFEFFTTHFEQGVSPTDVLPNAEYSVLTCSIRGTTELAKHTEDTRSQDQDPLQEALEYLEFGQIDEAQRLLETAILEQPERTALHSELLEIYQHAADKAGFDAMRLRLESIGQPFGGTWESMSNSSQEVVSR